MGYKTLVVGILVLALAGCATTGAKNAAGTDQVQQLQERVTDLERQLEAKDGQIGDLEAALTDARDAQPRISGASSVSVSMTSRNIQTALKNAGLYEGAIDGKIGSKTKKAIKDFQSANGLTVDGVVGKRTWEKLKTYLNN